jgi:hypothetical protein
MVHVRTLNEFVDSFAFGKINMENENMNLEILRIASFENWPSESCARPLPLARAGFFYSNISDEVICFSCGLRVSNWEPRQDPMSIHRRMAPHCKFINGNAAASNDASENIPLQDDEPSSSSAAISRAFEDLAQASPSKSAASSLATPSPPPADKQQTKSAYQPEGVAELSARDGRDPISSPSPVQSRSPVPNPLDGSGDLRSKPNFAYFDKMRSEKERLSTFHDWNYSHAQRPSMLAAAGFFYTGLQDRTQCAFCRGVLRSWESSDNPREEHVRHFPTCPFLSGRDVGNIPCSSSLDEQLASFSNLSVSLLNVFCFVFYILEKSSNTV